MPKGSLTEITEYELEHGTPNELLKQRRDFVLLKETLEARNALSREINNIRWRMTKRRRNIYWRGRARDKKVQEDK